MTGTHLPGLEGTNPLAFFAALGVQVAFEGEEKVPRLWWSDDVVPHAVVDTEFSVDRIASQVMKIVPEWASCRSLQPDFLGQEINDIKFSEENLRLYLKVTSGDQRGDSLAKALLAEGTLDNNGKSKPSDFHFTAGRMLFLKMAREVLEGIEIESVVEALEGTWSYESQLPSLGWDVTDDRLYALRATNPATNKKFTNPGPEVLAIFGLSRYPVFGSTGRTLTQGCSGTWKSGTFAWPIWLLPAGKNATASLLAHVSSNIAAHSNRLDWFSSWSISKIMRSDIRRNDTGGNGTFGPPEVIWSRG